MIGTPNIETVPKIEPPEFVAFPKMARLSRDCIVTEKIDGTNAVIQIGEDGSFHVGSRNRWLTAETGDNYGFLRWATEHRDELLALGPGRHFGEWWGSGIQRGYGLPKGEKRWSLFNTARWCLHDQEPQRIPQADPRVDKRQELLPACCYLVPVLDSGVFTTEKCERALDLLRQFGSVASPGFMQPEGIVVYHCAGNVGFKKTLVADDVPKGAK